MIINVNLLEQELPTLPKHMTSPPDFSRVRVVLIIQFLVFTFLVLCSDVRYDFSVEMFDQSSLLFVL